MNPDSIIHLSCPQTKGLIWKAGTELERSLPGAADGFAAQKRPFQQLAGQSQVGNSREDFSLRLKCPRGILPVLHQQKLHGGSDVNTADKSELGEGWGGRKRRSSWHRGTASTGQKAKRSHTSKDYLPEHICFNTPE